MRGHKNKISKFVALVLFAVLVSGCASTPNNDPGALAEIRKVNDPIEPTNRFIFKFNQGLDIALIKPITGLYRGIFPKIVRDGVHNFIKNLKAPVVLTNDILQGEAKRAGNTFIRFVINSTVGIAGVRDQAADWGFEGHKEDFGQTLAVWGVGEGPYLMLPVFGPSNPRDAIGKLVDRLIDPINWWADNTGRDWVPITRTMINGIDTRDRLWDVIDDLEKSSIDFYAAMRSLYRQRRNKDISNGANSNDNQTPNLVNNPDLRDTMENQQNSEVGQ